MPFDALPITNPAIKRLRFGRERVVRGWCQGEYQKNGNFCALGGIRGDGVHDNSEPDRYLTKAGGFSSHLWLIEWNDAPTRTKQDVLTLYDRAIELAIADELMRGIA